MDPDIRAYLETRRKEAVALLCDLIRMPSTRGNEGPVIRTLYERFRGRADACELVPVPESIVQDEDYSFPLKGLTYADRPNLEVVRRGEGGGLSLVFNTHVDVVPPSPGQDRAFDPEVRDGVVYGRGACDAKGQVAALYLALSALQDLDIRLKGDVTLHIVIEEECGGNGSLAMARRGCRADGAVVLEPSDLVLLPSVRGAVWFDVVCTGRAGHSGRAGDVVSALKKAAQAMDILERYHDRLLAASKGHPLFDRYTNPMPITFGVMRAGDWPATAPNRAEFKGVFGFLPNVTRGEVQREMRASLLREGDAWLREHFELSFLYRHDGNEIPVDHPLVKAAEAACWEAGREPKVGAMPASCDAWLYNNQLKIPTLVMGPGSLGYAHTNEEQIAVDDLLKGAEVLVRLIASWCNRKKPAECGRVY